MCGGPLVRPLANGPWLTAQAHVHVHCPSLPLPTLRGGEDTAASCISLAEGLKNAHGMTNPGSSARRRAYRFTWSEDQLAKMLTTHSGTPARSK